MKSTGSKIVFGIFITVIVLVLFGAFFGAHAQESNSQVRLAKMSVPEIVLPDVKLTYIGLDTAAIKVWRAEIDSTLTRLNREVIRLKAQKKLASQVISLSRKHLKATN